MRSGARRDFRKMRLSLCPSRLSPFLARLLPNGPSTSCVRCCSSSSPTGLPAHARARRRPRGGDGGVPERARPDPRRAGAEHLRRAVAAGVRRRPAMAAGRRVVDVHQLADLGHPRRAGVAVPVPQPSFYFVRNMFLVAFGVALIGYTVFPTAPPRFLPEWGFFDSVSDFTGVAAGQRDGQRAVQPVRRGALDARRLRAHDRHSAVPAGQVARAEGLLVRSTRCSSSS